MNDLARSTISPATLVAKFNKLFPVGTNVLYWPGVRDDLRQPGIRSKTKTQAEVLGGTAVVWVEGRSDCIALSHIEPFVETSFVRK